MTTRTGCTSTLLSSDYIFFFHQRNRVFGCLRLGQVALIFSEFIFNRVRKRKYRKGEKNDSLGFGYRRRTILAKKYRIDPNSMFR